MPRKTAKITKMQNIREIENRELIRRCIHGGPIDNCSIKKTFQKIIANNKI